MRSRHVLRIGYTAALYRLICKTDVIILVILSNIHRAIVSYFRLFVYFFIHKICTNYLAILCTLFKEFYTILLYFSYPSLFPEN